MKVDVAVKDRGVTRQKGRDRREQILGAAKQRLIKHGVEGLILRDLADDLGITHGNLQYYFKTKNALLTAIFDESVQTYTFNIREAINHTSSIEGRIAAIVDSSVQVLESEDTKLWRLLIGVADQNPELAQILKRENDFYEQTLIIELEKFFPDIGSQRHFHLAKIIRMLMDGLAVDLIYQDVTSPQYLALKGEIKAVLFTLFQSKPV